MFKKNHEIEELLIEKEKLIEKINSLKQEIDSLKEIKNENLGIADDLYDELIYNEKIVKNQKKND